MLRGIEGMLRRVMILGESSDDPARALEGVESVERGGDLAPEALCADDVVTG